MNLNSIFIRIATPEDAEELLGIYTPYVQKTAVTFEYDVPALSEFKDRIRKILSTHPYIVAADSSGIIGYCYTSPFHTRAAYAHSAETSIYIKESKRNMGVGKLLYQSVEDISKAQNILNLNACISYPDEEDKYLSKNSAQFHAHMGYSMVGETHKCGYKFGQWYNIVWMEKMIGEHIENPSPVIPFPELDSDVLSAIGIRR